MNLLTRVEEFILLAIWSLGDNAYSLAIQKKISEISEEKWSLGTIYAPLERLEKRGLLTNRMTDPTPERGGRQRRIYTITPEGIDLLMKTRKVEQSMWAIVSKYTERA